MSTPNKYAPGIPRFTWRWVFMGGTAFRVPDKKHPYRPIDDVPKEVFAQRFAEQSVRKDWRGRVIPAPTFKGKMPICKSFQRHRWLGTKCDRCKTTRKLGGKALGQAA